MPAHQVVYSIRPDEFKFSTSLRQTIPADSVLPLGHQSSTSHAPPSHAHAHHSKRSSHHDAFAHTAQTATPSGRYARMTAAQVLADLNSDASTGLSSHVIDAIRTLSGPNDFAVQSKENVYVKFLGQFYESPLNLLLLGSAAVSALVGNYDDAASISLAIIIVVTVGFVQEQRSEKSLEALNRLVPHYSHVLRDGLRRTELANILVPGDMVSFSVGDRIPADVRLTAASELEIDESSLTGETHPARKHTEPIDSASSDIPAIAERSNTAFMGTLVKSGRGAGVVVATGDSTEFGVIFAMMQDIDDRKTPLQVKMDELAHKLSLASFVIIGFICLIGVWQQRSWLEMFTIGVSLAVAAIPEGLPIVVTVTLALGVLRMSKRKAIVKKLPSVETLGSVSVICSDKTGTLTTNEMTVVRLFTVDDDVVHERQAEQQPLSQAMRRLLLIGNLCNHTFRTQEGLYVGSSTEVAAINAAVHLTGHDERARFVDKSAETPFNSELKWQSITGRHPLVANGERPATFYMGAAEALLSACSFYVRADGATAPMDASLSGLVAKKAADLSATMGTRIIAAAYRHVDEASPKETTGALPPSGLVFAGLLAMLDPPRRGVEDAVNLLGNGGIQVVMITGDSEATARSIASQIGIRVNPSTPAPTKTTFGSSSGADVMTGKEIDTLSQRQLAERITGVSVFARTTPRHKMALIEAYQSRGKVVAMTGDGVNDAPALKLADIGISMGKGATDVAKEAADMILVDDNFATIIPAVEEGARARSRLLCCRILTADTLRLQGNASFTTFKTFCVSSLARPSLPCRWSRSLQHFICPTLSTPCRFSLSIFLWMVRDAYTDSCAFRAGLTENQAHHPSLSA